MPGSPEELGYFLKESPVTCLLGESKGIKLTAGLGRPQDKGKDYKVEILHCQPSQYFVVKQELSLEALSMHKHSVTNKAWQQQ